MAWTIMVARRGRQRSRTSTSQAFRVAAARSPIARIRAWERLAASWLRQARPVALERGADRAAPRPGTPVGEDRDTGAGEGVDQAGPPGGGQIVHRVGQCG
ncbi:hypothetical protein GCM10014719_65600 [Planomonospora parontospora subsp. antibiotica]|nr:hypothetical protein GCM10014719_65600 [Planomonospora parontospora subsp. antibiotica]GII19786.1 hypothetical protein Ppa05_65120 [Planomonospora parontospora subsp. antibiotica]